MKALVAFVLLFSGSHAFASITSDDVFMKNGGDSKQGQEFNGSVDKKNKCRLKISQNVDGGIVLFVSVYNKKETKNYSAVFSREQIPMQWSIEQTDSYLAYYELASFVQYLTYDSNTLKLTSFQGYLGRSKLQICTFKN